MAEPRPGRKGTITSGMPSSRASSTAYKGPAPPKATKREITRIVAALHRDEADRARHVGARNAQDSGGGFRPRIAQRLRDPVDGLLGNLRVQHHPAGELCLCAEPAQHQVRIGRGGLGAALAVAGRPGPRAGALRPHLQHPALVDTGDGAAAGADGRDIHRGEADDDVELDVPLGPDQRTAPAGERDIGAGPAHVEDDHVGPLGKAADGGTRHHACRRPRLANPCRDAPRRLDGHHAAAGMGDEDRPVVADTFQPGEERGEIALQHRAEIGVGDGRAGALELADLGRDVGGAADVAARHLVGQDLLRAALMGIVDVAVEEAHRHRLDAPLAEPRRDGAQARLVERLQHLAFVGRALGDGHGVASVDQCRRRVPIGIVERGPGRARRMQHICEARRGHQCGAGAGAHDDRVGGDGGADLDELDVAGLGADGLDAGEHAVDEVGRGGRGLRDLDRAGLLCRGGLRR